MSRLARYVFTFASAMSLVLCITACVLWARSYGGTERLVWQNAGGWRWLVSRQGTFTVELLFADWSGHPAEWHGPRYSYSPRTPWELVTIETFTVPDRRERIVSWHAGRLAYRYRRRADGAVYLDATAPYWGIVLTTAALPAAWCAARWRARRRCRRAMGERRCPACGYDLRATPNRCPECGTVCSCDACVALDESRQQTCRAQLVSPRRAAERVWLESNRSAARRGETSWTGPF